MADCLRGRHFPCLISLQRGRSARGLALRPLLPGASHAGTHPRSVVFLAVDRTINPVLNPDEVSCLFSMSFAAFLHDQPGDIPGWNFGLARKVAARPRARAPVPMPGPPKYIDPAGAPSAGRRALDNAIGGRDGAYYQYGDIAWGGGMVRMHRFLTGREGGGVKPVYGLTA